MLSLYHDVGKFNNNTLWIYIVLNYFAHCVLACAYIFFIRSPFALARLNVIAVAACRRRRRTRQWLIHNCQWQTISHLPGIEVRLF